MRQDHQPTNGGAPAAPHVSPPQAAIPFAQRLTCTIAEACEATGLGRTKLYELIGAGCITTTTVGRRRLVLISSLVALIGSAGRPPANT
jgi:excisionase family DNA binding protein